MKINRVLVGFVLAALMFGARSASVAWEGSHEYASSVNAQIVLKTTTTSAGQNISYPRTSNDPPAELGAFANCWPLEGA